MGYICGKNVTIYNEGENNVWSLFYKYGTNGANIIKSRIYDAINITVIFGYKINHKFYKNYRYVDEICFKQSGVFYIIDLNNNFTKQTENIVLPSDIFDDNVSRAKLYRFVKNWLEYFDTWQITGGIYGQFENDW